MPGFVARADIDVDASPQQVWRTITAHASEVSLGATVESDWRPGSPISWKGEWEGKEFEDTGEILEAVVPYRLVLTHSTARHVITYELSGNRDGTRVELSQDGNASDRAASESAANWRKHLEAVKERAER